MTLMLRDSVEQDLPAVLATESDPDVSRWITVWTRERHVQAMRADDEAHMVFCERERTLGFLLLAGLGTPEIELRRIALTRRGEGIGAAALELALGYAFDILGAHRVWLDVLPENARAIALYARIGLQDDGEAPHAHLLPDGSSMTLRLMSIRKAVWLTAPGGRTS